MIVPPSLRSSSLVTSIAITLASCILYHHFQPPLPQPSLSPSAYKDSTNCHQMICTVSLPFWSNSVWILRLLGLALRLRVQGLGHLALSYGLYFNRAQKQTCATWTNATCNRGMSQPRSHCTPDPLRFYPSPEQLLGRNRGVNLLETTASRRMHSWSLVVLRLLRLLEV